MFFVIKECTFVSSNFFKNWFIHISQIIEFKTVFFKNPKPKFLIHISNQLLKKMTMKSLFPIFMVVLSVVVTLSCGTDPVVTPVVKTTYDKNVKAILVAKCAPCHVAGGVQPSKYDTYATAKAKVDLILSRVAKAETDPLFMPQNGKKLADSTIAVLTKWKTDGLLEK